MSAKKIINFSEILDLAARAQALVAEGEQWEAYFPYTTGPARARACWLLARALLLMEEFSPKGWRRATVAAKAAALEAGILEPFEIHDTFFPYREGTRVQLEPMINDYGAAYGTIVTPSSDGAYVVAYPRDCECPHCNGDTHDVFEQIEYR